MIKHLKRNLLAYIFGVPSVIYWIVVAYWGQGPWDEGVKQSVSILATSSSIALFVYLFVNSYKKIRDNIVNAIVNEIKNVDYRLDGLILLKEGVPHISMRVETAQAIFDKIIENSDNNPQILEHFGKTVAENFIDKSWPTMDSTVAGQEMAPQAKILKWAKMEKTAGWGEFNVSFLNLPDSKFSGTITVKNCFLKVGRKAANANLCYFLVGYCRHIIEALANFQVNVTEKIHNTDGAQNQNTCVFSFTPTV